MSTPPRSSFWSFFARLFGAKKKQSDPIVQWDDCLLTGNMSVDNQHKHLFKLTNDLQAAQHDYARQIMVLDELATYCVNHFATEEQMMLSTHYPEYAMHKSVHDAFAHQVTLIIQDFRAGKPVPPLVPLLTSWLIHHIGDSDKKFITWMRTGKL